MPSKDMKYAIRDELYMRATFLGVGEEGPVVVVDYYWDSWLGDVYVVKPLGEDGRFYVGEGQLEPLTSVGALKSFSSPPAPLKAGPGVAYPIDAALFEQLDPFS